ncbi:hypothetical protein DD581_33950 [Klebsiella pneumoniae]|nr:hypothetical protein DD581_33950 [Klebsiella pneumoniae]
MMMLPCLSNVLLLSCNKLWKTHSYKVKFSNNFIVMGFSKLPQKREHLRSLFMRFPREGSLRREKRRTHMKRLNVY